MILQRNFARPWDMSNDHRFPLGLAPLQAIRCTVPGCPCECFLQGKMQIRYCETCKHGWVPHALDKLGMRPIPTPAVNPAGSSSAVEPALPNAVFDVASLALYGCQALPIRLKILLDRLFSVLPPEDVVQVLSNFGWTLEDYARGYIIQDIQGRPLESWTVCTREEEPLVLQQFLRFGETRAIATRILQQQQQENEQTRERDSRDRDKMKDEPADSVQHKQQQHRIDSDIKKFLEKSQKSVALNNNATTTPVSSVATSAMPPPTFSALQSLQFPLIPGLSAPLHRFPLLPMPQASLSHMRLPVSGMPTLPLSPPMTSSIPMSLAQSPLGRLQGMQPFDYRKERQSRSPDLHRPLQQQLPQHRPASPRTSAGTTPLTVPPQVSTGNPASPLCLTKTTPSSAPAAPSSRSRSGSVSSSSELEWDDDDDDDVSENSTPNALNLTQNRRKDGDSHREGPSSLPEISDSLSDADKRLRKPPSPIKRSWNPMAPLGTQLINPATGKKRVQCNVCLKTFCDKGALKIHFSAVHLREMHKCTVEGCNMMFSSRRSRNRHSANPNPKLHSPHLRRKISPHDGRTAHPHPLLGLGLPPPIPFPPGMHSMGSLPLMPLHQEMNSSNPFSAGAYPDPTERDRGTSEAACSTNHSVSSLSSGGGDNISERENGGVNNAKSRAYCASSDGDDDEEDRLSHTSNDAEDDVNMDNPTVDKPIVSSKGVRKRKSQNPTRLRQPECEDRGYMSSDDENHKRFKNESEQMPKNGLPCAENQKPPQQHEEEARHQSGVAFNSELSLRNPDCSHNDDSLDSANALRQLEHLSQGRFGDLSRVKHENEDASDNENDSDPASPLSDSASSTLGMSIFGNFDIPVDKENPRRCTACGKIFQNHFGVKTHYQNVHLKLMHKCTVDGCQAAFPSKRSRDRHSANLNLHRKLLSTTATASSGSVPESASPTSPDTKAATPSDIFSALASNASVIREELLSRFYGNPEGNPMLGFNLAPFLPPPPSLYMPGFLGSLPFLNHGQSLQNNNQIMGKSASPPPSASPSPSLSDPDVFQCTVNGCTKAFSSAQKRNLHCQDDHQITHEMAGIRTSV